VSFINNAACFAYEYLSQLLVEMPVVSCYKAGRRSLLELQCHILLLKCLYLFVIYMNM
jgi:hypothetical protein